jgi:SecD/SecF fusion protein
LVVMDKRVNEFGVAEPVLRPVGDLSLEIQLPGEDAANNPDIIDALKKPAKLEFRQVHRTRRPEPTDREHLLKALPDDEMAGNNSAISTYEVLTQRNVDSRTGEVKLQRYFVKKRADAGGSIIRRSRDNSQDGLTYMVDMTFTEEGGVKFGDLTKKISEGNTQGSLGQLAIVLDGVLQSAPTVQKPIYGGNAQITGNFSREEAKGLANVLNNPLEFPLLTQDVTSVGPSLAKDAQAKSVVGAARGVGLRYGGQFAPHARRHGLLRGDHHVAGCRRLGLDPRDGGRRQHPYLRARARRGCLGQGSHGLLPRRL